MLFEIKYACELTNLHIHVASAHFQFNVFRVHAQIVLSHWQCFCSVNFTFWVHASLLDAPLIISFDKLNMIYKIFIESGLLITTS